MKATGYELAVFKDAAFGVMGAFLGGLLVVAALIWAVRLGIKVRRREPEPPKPHEQPRLPETGAVHETRETPEPNEVPRAADGGERLNPQQVRQSGSTTEGENQPRPRWDSGSGGFGSGGPGRT
ncbi:DUF6479 family protein [Streptomyces sp. NPDC005551]|uniref:DUF6479 family protein n=1 Tax=unclassified Streptomyces TaxID=2593676 RepID=UPI0033D76C09